MGESEWPSAPPNPAVAADEIHVWCARVEMSADPPATVLSLLSPQERARAAHIPSTRRRGAFVFGRALLRQILARYLRVPVARVELEHGPHGKPLLSQAAHGNTLRFNLSHSGSLVLVAIADGREVGVDVECIRSDFDHASIVQRFFAPQERAEYAALPPELRSAAFWRGWVRKEAYLKGLGGGLTSLALDRFVVSLSPDLPAFLPSGPEDPGRAPRWSLQDVELGEDYVGAVAAEGRGWRSAFWRWEF